MNNMISIASGFQYSVNIGYDLNSNDKLQNFIPTKAALSFIKDILISTNPLSTNRARVLVGAYGKGKSHIVLTTMALLMKKDRSLFTRLMPRIEEDPAFQQLVDNYYDGEIKLLPIIITGSSTSLSQSFLLALQRTLSDNDMLDIMPESNYKAAVAVINRWETDFPQTYNQLKAKISIPLNEFIERLECFDIAAYEIFESVYPTLTAGGVFNPFLDFDVVDLYESVAVALKDRGYSGLYVVYDEFSKYLEANINNASVSDIKMLQDFAEKCNRSANLQMHLLLISHKEISNYIDKLPKQKVDGWRGVSERFSHLHLNNNFSQTYEVISSVVQKDEKKWNAFCKKYSGDFESLICRYGKHTIFSSGKDEINLAVFGCYPLHPVSTFILPRLSEKVAQNERTLFTFLSADSAFTLSSFLKEHNESRFNLVTPDYIYDYFEPLFIKEAFASDIHANYTLTNAILARLSDSPLEQKIVKTISLIYILEQFERLAPTVEEIVGVFSNSYTVDEIQEAIDNLITNELVVYLKRSNGFLRLKKTSNVDVKQTISDLVQSQSANITIKDALNASNFDNYMYPSRYNDEREMTRYFAFEFIEDREAATVLNWNEKCSSVAADGVIYAVVPSDEDSIAETKEMILNSSTEAERIIFILPQHFTEIESVVRELIATSTLMEKALNDPILFEEYEIIYEDLRELLKVFMNGYIHPEEGKAAYIYNGNYVDVRRKSTLTELMSQICDHIYSMTPVINNEAVNRNEITNIAANSRNKIVAALLRNDLEANLGLSGTGQEVSIMRSTLVRTGIWDESSGSPKLNLNTGDEKLDNLLSVIQTFVINASRVDRVSFDLLYTSLCSPQNRIGLRRGLIPIYLAVVLHEYKQQIIISDRFGQVPISADVLTQINANPKQFSLSYIEWDTDKKDYLNELAKIFADYVVSAESKINNYEFIANAMKRWYLALPKYAKDCKRDADSIKIKKSYIETIAALRQNHSGYELLFSRIPHALNSEVINAETANSVKAVKKCYDSLLDILKASIIRRTKSLFLEEGSNAQIERMSLPYVASEWVERLDPHIHEQMFPDGTEHCIALFRNQTNDEDTFVARLAKLCTDLRIEDWANDTFEKYISTLEMYKKTAEGFHSKVKSKSQDATSNYEITFADKDGKTVTKRFDHVDYSRRGQLLLNQVQSAVNSMGRSISEQEKRQVLMEVLKQLL